jgi:hypothetical protein
MASAAARCTPFFPGTWLHTRASLQIPRPGWRTTTRAGAAPGGKRCRKPSTMATRARAWGLPQLRNRPAKPLSRCLFVESFGPMEDKNRVVFARRLSGGKVAKMGQFYPSAPPPPSLVATHRATGAIDNKQSDGRMKATLT